MADQGTDLEDNTDLEEAENVQQNTSGVRESVETTQKETPQPSPDTSQGAAKPANKGIFAKTMDSIKKLKFW